MNELQTQKVNISIILNNLRSTTSTTISVGRANVLTSVASRPVAIMKMWEDYRNSKMLIWLLQEVAYLVGSLISIRCNVRNASFSGKKPITNLASPTVRSIKRPISNISATIAAISLPIIVVAVTTTACTVMIEKVQWVISVKTKKIAPWVWSIHQMGLIKHLL